MKIQSRSGFTLIEVLISVAILATLSMLAARSIQQGVQSKTKIQGQIDDVSRLRDALRLMERDINLAYHHLDFERDLNDLVKKLNNQSTTTPAPPREAPRRSPVTHFVGANDQMSFVTMNNSRHIRNLRQADFVEVGYSVRDCRSADGSRSSKCLWRRVSSVVDHDVTVGGDEVVLIEDVSDFELQYIGKGKQDWVTTWRSDRGGDAVTRNNFPQAVEITLGVSKATEGAKKDYKLTIVASVHFPNNPDPASQATAPGGAGGAPVPGPTDPDGI